MYTYQKQCKFCFGGQIRVYDRVSNYDPCFYNVYSLYSWSKYQVRRIARFAILHRTLPTWGLKVIIIVGVVYQGTAIPR